jgi:hypothetical protein
MNFKITIKSQNLVCAEYQCDTACEMVDFLNSMQCASSTHEIIVNNHKLTPYNCFNWLAYNAIYIWNQYTQEKKAGDQYKLWIYPFQIIFQNIRYENYQ